MLHLTVSYFAWIVVVLIQAFVHIWILKGSKRRDEIGSVTLLLYDMNAGAADVTKALRQRSHTSTDSDDQVPSMVPHVQVSEDEFEDEPEQESFDGDEPLLFFELLDKTGLELIKSCSSLESLIHEQVIKVDGMEIAFTSINPKTQLRVD